MTSESTAMNLEVKPYAFIAAQKAVQDCLTQNNLDAHLEESKVQGQHRVRYNIKGTPKVSIVIPTAGRIRQIGSRNIDLLATCVRSIVERTDYENYEMIVVDNGDLLPETTNALVESVRCENLLRVTYTKPFNIADKMNFGAEFATGEHILFLNDDTEVLSDEWLRAMLEYSQQPCIGAVGAKLYFPNRTIQHAGVVLEQQTLPKHIYYGFPTAKGEAQYQLDLVHNYSAVTGACMMTRREVFHEVQGFDITFPVNYNDIDYCLKVREKGYRIVYTPYAELIHYESVSRTGGATDQEMEHFQEVWCERFGTDDPYYNPLEDVPWK